MAAETKVIINMDQKGIEITCKHCEESQTYTMRSKKIPERPKTQCQNCEKWIYIDKSLLVKDDQRDLIKNDNNLKFKKTQDINKCKINPEEKILYRIETIDYTLNHINNKLSKEKEKDIIKFREKVLQNLLIEFPQIIEPNLRFLKLEYLLGETYYRGDLLFLDSEKKRLNIEIKVVVPSFKNFSNQIGNYLDNIGKEERLMYVAPKLTEAQKEFCKTNNIENKIIDLNKILEW